MWGFLLDTNHLSAALRPASPVRERITQECRRGIRIGTCIPVLCELEVGILQARKPDSCRRYLYHMLDQVRIWPIDMPVVRLYGKVYFELLNQGRVLSSVDISLVALARHLNLCVLTSDKDFDALPDLQTRNWLAVPQSS